MGAFLILTVFVSVVALIALVVDFHAVAEATTARTAPVLGGSAGAWKITEVATITVLPPSASIFNARH